MRGRVETLTCVPTIWSSCSAERMVPGTLLWASFLQRIIVRCSLPCHDSERGCTVLRLDASGGIVLCDAAPITLRDKLPLWSST